MIRKLFLHWHKKLDTFCNIKGTTTTYRKNSITSVPLIGFNPKHDILILWVGTEILKYRK